MLHNLGTLVRLLVVRAWRSLSVDATTIAIGAMGILMLCTVYIVLNTTVCSVSDLCVVQCSSFVDLLLDKVKGVHLSSPEVRDFSPVPSVVCVPVEITFWYMILDGLYQF